MFNQYADNKDNMGPSTFVLRFAKVKCPAVHKSLFGTRIFINKDIPDIIEFRKRYIAKDGFDEAEYKIELFSPEKVKITAESFFKDTVKCMVAGIRDVEPRILFVFSTQIYIVYTKSTAGAMMRAKSATIV